MPYFTPAQSSAVSHVRYDPQHRRLYVTFRDSGEMYVYLNVPSEDYDALLAADSIGRFINERIKDRYKFQHLTDPA
jgi:hypothetical protein